MRDIESESSPGVHPALSVQSRRILVSPIIGVRMSKHRDLLHKKIIAQTEERAASFIESRNACIHEVGIQRGYLMALRDVLELSNEIEREMNEA